MSLYAIADPHLSLSADKSMTVFSGWDDYVTRLEQKWCALVSPEDTVVIAGDVSWAMSLADTRTDFAFLQALPGKKLLLKGNHDYWWCTRRKMDQFLCENGLDTLSFIHNDTCVVDDRLAVCGSRGWLFDDTAPENRKIILREAGRLRLSIQAARTTGKEPVVFLHYPPVGEDTECGEIMDVLREEHIGRCYYGHIHGAGIAHAFQGEKDGIRFRLISCDALAFTPLLVPAEK